MPPTSHLVSLAIAPLDNFFLYRVSGEFVPRVGDSLEVPFARRTARGFIVSVDGEREETSSKEMSERGVAVREVRLSERPDNCFLPQQIEFFEWIAKYHDEPLSRILDMAIPAVKPVQPPKVISIVEAAETGKIGKRQQELLVLLRAAGGRMAKTELLSRDRSLSSVVRAAIAKGLVEESVEIESSDAIPRRIPTALPPLELNPDQAEAAAAIVESVQKRRFQSFLLHGVTGSGKTEVYISAAIEALNIGRGCLIVVPEIALTPQLIDRFRARLGSEVAVLHSSLKPRDRWANWVALLEGKSRIAIGARSAVFAPVRDLGLVVVDEEHDSSFKQGEGIRYHGRDLAIVRAKLSGCPVVLGSATPSLETYYNASIGRHRKLSLHSRFFSSSNLAFKVIDMNRVRRKDMPSSSISPEFLNALRTVLDRGEQAFVLYNRRGFATYFQCTGCEHVLGCPHCSVTLTYHQRGNVLLCHFCGFSTAPLLVCPSCNRTEAIPDPDQATPGEPLFAQRGAGTERVFDELKEILPQARLGKLDRDAVQSLDDYVTILGKVRSGEVNVLVGTQMIAKGHDLPDVTFVGIVDCDIGLHMPDFRAGERAFQLLTQASGRAGRREKPGQVVLQTRVPSHLSLRKTVTDDYEGFVVDELKVRELLGYPPFQRLLRVIISAEDRKFARDFAMGIALRARAMTEAHEVTMLGPAPAPIEKIRSLWRYHLLFKAASTSNLHTFLQRLRQSVDDSPKVRVVFDLDPQDML